MLSISRILAPVDFSTRCLGMMPLVEMIATRYGSQVTLIHVVNPFYTVPPTAISGPIMIPVAQSEITDSQKRLDEFATQELKGVAAERYVYEGDPAGQIVEYAKTEQIDLIVMPTHGYGALRRFLVGSVTAKILHDAGCPVLTGVHMEDEPAGAAAPLANILCGIDFRPQSLKTLAWASNLASDFKAKLSILHSLEPIPSEGISELPPEFRAAREKAARTEIERLQRETQTEGITAHIQEGKVAETLSAFATFIGADLVVIGRGAEDEAGGRLSSTAYGIVRQSPCPVISI